MQREIGATAGLIWKRERGIVVGAAQESGDLQDTHLQLGHRLGGTRRQDCDHLCGRIICVGLKGTAATAGAN